MPRAPAKLVVKLTANFESNLSAIEEFYAAARADRAYEVVIEELLDTVIPNLETFPDMGRPLFSRQAHSIEVSAAQTALRATLGKADLREYILKTTIVLYARIDQTIHLLAIKDQRQLSFDFDHLWAAKGRP